MTSSLRKANSRHISFPKKISLLLLSKFLYFPFQFLNICFCNIKNRLSVLSERSSFVFKPWTLVKLYTSNIVSNTFFFIAFLLGFAYFNKVYNANIYTLVWILWVLSIYNLVLWPVSGYLFWGCLPQIKQSISLTMR